MARQYRLVLKTVLNEPYAVGYGRWMITKLIERMLNVTIASL